MFLTKIDRRTVSEFIRMTEAQQRLGMAKNTFRAFVQRNGVTTYENPRDRREKLVDWNEIEEMLCPRPIRPDEGRKGICGRPI